MMIVVVPSQNINIKKCDWDQPKGGGLGKRVFVWLYGLRKDPSQMLT